VYRTYRTIIKKVKAERQAGGFWEVIDENDQRRTLNNDEFIQSYEPDPADLALGAMPPGQVDQAAEEVVEAYQRAAREARG
jgi:hypothetical protein